MSIILHSKRRFRGLFASYALETTRKRVRTNRGKERNAGGLSRLIANLIPVLALACSPVPPHPEISPPVDGFSVDLAEAHLDAMSELSPRLPGSEADQAVRSYLIREFGLAGAEAQWIPEGGRDHLLAEVRGAFEDRVLLVAPYSLMGSNEWVDDSGAALFLELVRYFSRHPPLYTLQFALADTRPAGFSDVPRGAEAPEGGLGAAGAVETREWVSEAGRSLAGAMADRSESSGIRAVIAFEPRAGSHPRMARDLKSHPVYRSIFWQSAAALGYEDVFSPDAGWSSTEGLQTAFQGQGLGRVLALVDERIARAELHEGLGRPGLGDERGPVGLEPTGRVTIEALTRLMRRFEKMDAFSQ